MTTEKRRPTTTHRAGIRNSPLFSSEPLTRRQAIALTIATGTGIAVTAGAVVYGRELRQNGTDNPQVGESLPVEFHVAAINEFEKQDPEVPNWREQIIKHSAAVFADRFPRSRSAEDLVKSVTVVNNEAYVKLAEKINQDLDQNPNLPEPRVPYTVIDNDGRIYLNGEAIKQAVETLEEKDPGIEVVLTRAMLFRSFALTSMTHDPIMFGSGFSFGNPDGEGYPVIDGFKNFKFHAQRNSGGETFIRGVDEASADIVAETIAQDLVKAPLIPEDRYLINYGLLLNINRVAKISGEDFLVYVSGQKPYSEYLSKIQAMATKQTGLGITNPEGVFALLTQSALFEGEALTQLVDVVNLVKGYTGIDLAN